MGMMGLCILVYKCVECNNGKQDGMKKVIRIRKHMGTQKGFLGVCFLELGIYLYYGHDWTSQIGSCIGQIILVCLPITIPSS